MTTGMAGWTKGEVAALCRSMRRGWTQHIQKPHLALFYRLLLNLQRGAHAPSVERVAKLIGKHRSKDAESSKAIAAIRKVIRRRSKLDFPGLSIDIPHGIYCIAVSGECPDALRTRMPHTIGLLVANANDWFTGRTIDGVLRHCCEREFDLVVDASDDDRDRQDERLVRMSARVEGILLIPVHDVISSTAIQLLRQKPSVLLDRYVHNATGLLTVHHNDWLGGRMAARYLEGLKCERVIIVKQHSTRDREQQLSPLKDRDQGCREELHRYGIKLFSPAAVGEGEAGGVAALETFHFSDNGPLKEHDGIFATTDRLALGCRKFLEETVPKLNIPVIGFEGQSFGEYLRPPLASVFADPAALGYLAAQLLVDELTESTPRKNHPPHYLVEPTLWVPNSSNTGREEKIIELDRKAALYEPDAEARKRIIKTSFR